MKITAQTPTHLILEDHNQQWVWGMLLGIPFVGVGVAIALSTATLTTLTCQRSGPGPLTCQRTLADFRGTTTHPLPGPVTGASVITDHGTGVVLATAQGSVELVNHRTVVREKHNRIAQAINTFIQDPQQQSLTIQQDDRAEGLLAAAAFLLPGLAIILQSLALPIQVRCELDRSSGQMTLTKVYRFAQPSITQRPLADMQQAQVVQFPNVNRNPVFGVQLDFRSTAPISLSVWSRDRTQCQSLVDAIQRVCDRHSTEEGV